MNTQQKDAKPDKTAYEFRLARWVIVQRIAIVAISTIGAYFISPWCFLLLLACHTLKEDKK